jgi:hypothetical protein
METKLTCPSLEPHDHFVCAVRKEQIGGTFLLRAARLGAEWDLPQMRACCNAAFCRSRMAYVFYQSFAMFSLYNYYS